MLPTHVPHADAAFNAGRAALLVEALARRPDLLLDATDDRLHQAYRADVMPSSFELVQALRARGLAATVSGAGPTVLVLSAADRLGEVARVADSLVGGTADWAVHRLDVDTRGVVGERL